MKKSFKMSNMFIHHGIQVTETDTSIFDISAQAIVNPVNLVGVAGRGLAKEFKLRYPEMFAYYKAQCESEQFQLGSVLVYYLNDTSYYKRNETEMIINFPTKLHWRTLSDYAFIEEGLRALSRCTNGEKLYSIAIPPLGCGLGGLAKHHVKEMILELYCPYVYKYLKSLYLLQF